MVDQENKPKLPYCPDYATPPGYVLRDHIEAKGMTPAEFADRHSVAAGLIESIIAGEAPIDAELAGIFGREFSFEAEFWLDIEAEYRRRIRETAASDVAN